MEELESAGPVAWIAVGSPAPDFELPEVRGGTIRLSAVAKKDWVVVVFYRGGWCAMCAQQLGTLSADHPRFRAAGAEILAISHEEVAKGRELLDKMGPPFKLLKDPQSLVIRQYGLVVRTRDMLGTVKGKHDYAHPAVFLVDRAGIIRWKYVGKDYKD